MSKNKHKPAKRSALARIGSALFLGIFVASLMLTSLTRLDIGEATPAWAAAARDGNLMPLFLSADFWSHFPTFATDATALVAPLPIALALVIVIAGTVLMRRLLRRTWSTVGCSILAVGLAPLIAGAFGAFAGNQPTDISSWLAILVVTPLYCSVVCCACAVLDVVIPNATEKRSIKSRPAAA